MQAAGLEPGVPSPDGPTFFQRFTLYPRRPPEPWLTLPTQNVVGLLVGSDPVLRNAVVVVGAHHDGQGRAGEADMGRRPGPDDAPPGDTIWNAANDNASGVAALLEVARVVAAGPRTSRSIVFVTFSGEEHGLVGSLHYVAHPPVPWGRHVAMLNLEMVGWDGDRAMNARGTGSSPAWSEVLDRAASATGYRVTTRGPAVTNDTDHYGFAERGVPAIHFGVGGSREHYHRVTDSPDRIAVDALVQRTRFMVAALREIANRSGRLPFVDTTGRDLGITGVGATERELEEAGLADSGGVKVTAVVWGSPAFRAGLRAGDLVISFDGKGLPRSRRAMREVAQAVRLAPTGRAVPLAIWREGVRLTVMVRFEDAPAARTQRTPFHSSAFR